MKREVVTTDDGSHTLYVPELNEHYHSTFGAIQESMHIFIKAGIEHCNRKYAAILEAGFGTGLNAILSLIYAGEHDMKIVFHSVEKYPLSIEEVKMLNYTEYLPKEIIPLFYEMHRCEWDKEVELTPFFSLYKHREDFREINFPAIFDIIFFDAFNPEVQPDLWSEETLGKFCRALKEDGILTTYCVKGIVKQALRNAGLRIERLPGPPGKREMLRGIKRHEPK